MLDKKTIHEAIQEAEKEEKRHLAAMRKKGEEIGEIQKEINFQQGVKKQAEELIQRNRLNKQILAEELQDMKIREAQIKGTKEAFQKMLDSI